MIKRIRLSHFPKNILIAIPALISGISIDYFFFFDLLKILAIFFFLTICCYIINYYSDRKIDKFNKLKNNVNINFKNSLILLLIFFSILIFLIIVLKEYNNLSIYFYFLNFVIYNFYTKQIKYLDIFFLTNFYIIRILCGIEVFNLEISYGFLIFAYCFFISFSVLKRLIQIKKINLKNNKIIAYNLGDIGILEKILITFMSLNLITFIFYIFFNLEIFKFKSYIFAYSFQVEKIIIIFLVYLVFILKVLYSYFKGNIRSDIYKYVIKDKFSYFLGIFLIIIMFF